MKTEIIYLIIINIITFITYGIDKAKARKGAWRIPEKTLIGLAVAGGSIGALAGMSFFHHKTRKPLFKIGIPVILLIEAVAAAWLQTHI
mgnify:FL=1